MSVPTWIMDLKSGDELLVCFPYYGKTHYAEFISHHIPSYQPRSTGIKINYVKDGINQTVFLHYDDYKNDPSSHHNWFGYPVTN